MTIKNTNVAVEAPIIIVLMGRVFRSRCKQSEIAKAIGSTIENINPICRVKQSNPVNPPSKRKEMREILCGAIRILLIKYKITVNINANIMSL